MNVTRDLLTLINIFSGQCDNKSTGSMGRRSFTSNFEVRAFLNLKCPTQFKSSVEKIPSNFVVEFTTLNDRTVRYFQVKTTWCIALAVSSQYTRVTDMQKDNMPWQQQNFAMQLQRSARTECYEKNRCSSNLKKLQHTAANVNPWWWLDRSGHLFMVDNKWRHVITWLMMT